MKILVEEEKNTYYIRINDNSLEILSLKSRNLDEDAVLTRI